jgi:copper chaperone
MNTKEYKIEGMSCQHCVMDVKTELENIKGLVVKNIEIGKVIVEFDQERVDEKNIEEAVNEAGCIIAS